MNDSNCTGSAGRFAFRLSPGEDLIDGIGTQSGPKAFVPVAPVALAQWEVFQETLPPF